MYLLIPLGGLGVRFKNCGYKKPKPLVNVFGKEIIFWLLDNLNLTNITHIIIPYNKELKQYNFEELLRKRYPLIQFVFKCLEKNTQGAIETIYTGLCSVSNGSGLGLGLGLDKPILLLDGDNFYTTDVVGLWGGKNVVFAFEDHSSEPIYSYISTSTSSSIIIDIMEKSKISNLACTGAYGFESVFQLKELCKYVLDNNIRMKDEFYTSVAINEGLKAGMVFHSRVIDQKNYVCLGTPLQVRLFCNNYPKVKCSGGDPVLNPLRICWDLDNTLVTYPEIPNDYTTVKPIQKNIDMLKYLKKFGHTIIIHTARKMKSSGSNIGKVNKDVGKITFDTLDKFDIPYDEIYFGKPYAHFYIDDLAVNAFESLEKELGFYKNSIEPRDFHNVSKSSMEIIKKQSTNTLDGEIHYYLNIPSDIKDMFPVMFEYDVEHYKWFVIEFINGIPISKLFLSQELSVIQFRNIMSSLERVHNSVLTDVMDSVGHVNIYDNYSKKLTKRFGDYDYTVFDGWSEIYNELIEGLDEYERENWGKIGVIHGDPVFTNIIVNKYEKIKFIDMRGKIGDVKTIYGDVMYDWAKFYQSLIGYDEILDDKELSIGYVNVLKKVFEDRIIELYGEVYMKHIKLITKSLLFSLIPLHNNAKCVRFFELIKKI